jgi:amidase
LWGNAGFNSLRKLDLDDYEPRYDPTVVPIGIDSSSINPVDPPYKVGPRYANRHYSIADYHSAYESGKITPTAVAQAILALVPKHKEAFLDIVKDQVLAAAEESTQRYKEGRVRGMLDGVPLGVKGKLPNYDPREFCLNFCCVVRDLLMFPGDVGPLA